MQGECQLNNTMALEPASCEGPGATPAISQFDSRLPGADMVGLTTSRTAGAAEGGGVSGLSAAAACMPSRQYLSALSILQKPIASPAAPRSAGHLLVCHLLGATVGCKHTMVGLAHTRKAQVVSHSSQQQSQQQGPVKACAVYSQ